MAEFKPYNYGTAAIKGNRIGLEELAAQVSGEDAQARRRLSGLAERIGQGDQAAIRERATLDPQGTQNIMDVLGGMDDGQRAEAKKRSETIAKMMAAASDENQFNTVIQMLNSNGYELPPDVNFKDKNLYIAEAQELADILKRNEAKWGSPVESGAGGGRMGKFIPNLKDPSKSVQLGQSYDKRTAKGGSTPPDMKIAQWLQLENPSLSNRDALTIANTSLADPTKAATDIAKVKVDAEWGNPNARGFDYHFNEAMNMIRSFRGGGANQGGGNRPGTTTAPPAAAIEYLRNNPGMAGQFEQKYGISAKDFLN